MNLLFLEETINPKKERIKLICQEMLKSDLKISWGMRPRLDNVDEESLFWMKRAGCIEVAYSFESGSEEILRRINKQINLSQACGIYAKSKK